jgi:hypothetical protein
MTARLDGRPPVRWQPRRRPATFHRYAGVPADPPVEHVLGVRYDPQADLLELRLVGGRHVWLTQAGGRWRPVVPAPAGAR